MVMTNLVKRATTVLFILSFLTVLGYVSGCVSFIKDRIVKGGYEEAISRLDTLKQDGSLPGFTKQEHGQVWFILPILKSKAEKSGSYPLTVTLYANKDDEKGIEYEYLVVKKAPSSTWEIVKAWKRSKERREQIYPR